MKEPELRKDRDEIFCGLKRGKKMKKSMKKRVLPILLIASFVTLVMSYDEKERILED